VCQLFQQAGPGVDHIFIYDLLESTYYDVEFIMNLDYDDGWLMIKRAQKRQREHQAWEQYIAQYPHFTKETFVTFEEFYTPDENKKPVKTTEAIFAEVQALREGVFSGVI